MSSTTKIEEFCHCGRRLHYSDQRTRRFVEEQIAMLGSRVPVTVGSRTWLVPRHYIALHGLLGADLPTLGFEEVPNETTEKET